MKNYEDQAERRLRKVNDIKTMFWKRSSEEEKKDLAKLLRVLKLPKDFTGEVPYKDYKIRIQRRTIIQFMSK